MPLTPGLARAQDQSLVPAQVQSQAPTGTQPVAPQPSQDNATQADGNCPGHPGALGTSRVLALDPAQYPRVGHMQYPDTLPLNDKEVVLTFDDGPVPPYSNEIRTHQHHLLTERLISDARALMSALGHVWTVPWQELSHVVAALVGCGHVSGLT